MTTSRDPDPHAPLGFLAAIPPGVRYMAASAFAFSLMSLCVKVVSARLPSQEIVLARAAISLVLSGGLLRRAGRSPWGRRRGMLVLRGVLGFGGLSCFYYAITHLPLGHVTVLH